MTLAPHGPAALDRVDWSGTQNASLTSILASYQKCEAKILGSHRWLLDWKRARSDRAIQLKVEDRPLPGKPEFELELLDHTRGCASVWLSFSSPNSLISWATDKWQNGLTVNFFRETGQVIVVDPSGKFERKFIGEPGP